MKVEHCSRDEGGGGRGDSESGQCLSHRVRMSIREAAAQRGEESEV